MNIKRKEENDKTIILLEGRLDKISSAEVEEELKKEIDKKRNLVLDFKDLQYISSAGLRILIALQKDLKENGNTMNIINVNDDVFDILNVTGFTYILNVDK